MTTTLERSMTDEYEELQHAVRVISPATDHTYNWRVSYDGGELTTIFNTLLRLMEKEHIVFRFVDGFSDMPTSTGRTDMEPGHAVTIMLSHTCDGRPLPRVSQVYTLLHELAHYFTPRSWMNRAFGRDAIEIVAETACYIVAARLGFKGIDRSASYVKNWAYGNGSDTRMLKKHSLLVAERLWEAFQLAVDA